MSNRILYGGCNPALDDELEAEIREQNPHMNNKNVLKEMNKIKQKATCFNGHNTKSKSTKKPKKDKHPKPKKDKR